MSEMLFKRIKDWVVSITSFRNGDVIPVDGPSGTAKMAKDDLLKVTAQNALAGNVAPAFDTTIDYTIGQKVIADGESVVFSTFHQAGPFDKNETSLAVDNDGKAYILSRENLYINTAKAVGEYVSFTPVQTSSSFKFSVIDVTDIYSVIFDAVHGGSSARVYCFTDASGKVLSVASAVTQYTGEVLVPLEAKYVVVNFSSGSFSLVKKNAENLMSYEYFSQTSVGNKIDTVPKTSSTAYTTIYAKSTAGSLYRIKGKGGSSARLFMFLDANFVVLALAAENINYDGFIEAPQGTAWIIVSFHPSVDYVFENVTDSKEVMLTDGQKLYYDTSAIGSSVNINSRSVSGSVFVSAVCKLEGIKNIICIGEGGGSPRLWAFLDSSNSVISCAGASAIGSSDLIPVPQNADKVIFQSRTFGRMFLLQGDTIPAEVGMELNTLSHPDKVMMDNFTDSNGYMVNAVIPINLQKSNECAVITIISERFGETTPSFGIGIDDVYYNIYQIKGKNYKSLNRYRIPPLQGKNAHLKFFVDGAQFKLLSMSVSYESPNTAPADCGLRYDAHLGLQAWAPENTLAAFGLAAQSGFHGCVTNPIFSADGTGYCYHENDDTLTLDGVTALSLSAEEFAAKSDADLANYKVFGLGQQRQKFLEKIPTLEEYFDLCKNTGMKPVFSTHPIPSTSQLELIKSMLDQRGLTKSLTIKAFNLSWLDVAFDLFGKIDGYVFDTSDSEGIDGIIANVKNTNFYHAGCRSVIELYFDNMTQEAAYKVNAAGLLLSTWGVPRNAASYAATQSMGVSIYTEKGYNCSVGLNW